MTSRGEEEGGKNVILIGSVRFSERCSPIKNVPIYIIWFYCFFFCSHCCWMHITFFSNRLFLSNKNDQLQLSENSNLCGSYSFGNYISETEMTCARNGLCFRYYRLQATTDEQIAQQNDNFLLRVLAYSRTLYDLSFI